MSPDLNILWSQFLFSCFLFPVFFFFGMFQIWMFECVFVYSIYGGGGCKCMIRLEQIPVGPVSVFEVVTRSHPLRDISCCFFFFFFIIDLLPSSDRSYFLYRMKTHSAVSPLLSLSLLPSVCTSHTVHQSLESKSICQTISGQLDKTLQKV